MRHHAITFRSSMHTPVRVAEVIDTSNRCLWNKLVKNPTGPTYNLLPPTRTPAVQKMCERCHDVVLSHAW